MGRRHRGSGRRPAALGADAVTGDGVKAHYGAELGAPTTPEDLHWPRRFYGEAVRHAREIRNRYTFLDLAADSGMLDDAENI